MVMHRSPDCGSICFLKSSLRDDMLCYANPVMQEASFHGYAPNFWLQINLLFKKFPTG